MRCFAFSIGIMIVALAPCILGDPPPPPADPIPAINDNNVHEESAKLLDEIFPDWEEEVNHAPGDLPHYERWHHALEEAYTERANVAAGSRTFRALQSRFTGDGAPCTRQDVVAGVLTTQEGMTPRDVTTVSARIMHAETHEEFTDEVAQATANALMEGIGVTVPGVGDDSYSIIDFEAQHITAMFAMALFPTSGKSAS